MGAFEKAWVIIKISPIVFNEIDGSPTCGKCGTMHHDEDLAFLCCSNCKRCGYREHGLEDKAARCCPCTCGNCDADAEIPPSDEELKIFRTIADSMKARNAVKETFGGPDKDGYLTE